MLTDLLDNYNALKLTNKIIVEGKRQLMKIIKPELMPSKKRKLKQISNKDENEDYVHKLIDEFEHEEHLQKFYTKEELKDQKIFFDQFDEFQDCI